MSDDLEAIGRVLAGDAEAFRPLVERYQGPVHAVVRNLLPGADVEDLAQETFLAAFVHLRTFDAQRAPFSTWLFAIARNKCLNALKRRWPAPGPLPEPSHGRTPEVEAAGAEVARRLDEGLAALPFEQRAAFVLAEVHGLPLAEVGRIEGVSVGTVKSRLGRARAKLRGLLAGLEEAR